MVEEKVENKTPDEPVEEHPSGGRAKWKGIDPTIHLLALLTVLVLSLSYFFVFALPRMQRDRLAWEKEQYERKVQIREAYDRCVDAAEEEYGKFIRMNGTAVDAREGAWSAPEQVWETADKRRAAALDECSRRYGR